MVPTHPEYPPPKKKSRPEPPRAEAGKIVENVVELTKRFQLQIARQELGYEEASATSVDFVDRPDGRVPIRIRMLSSADAMPIQMGAGSGPIAGAIDGVQIVRFDYQSPPQQFRAAAQQLLVFRRMQGQSGGFHGSSPILLLKNFNQDRGLRLFETCFGKDGQDYVNGSAPMTAWMHQFMPSSAARVRRQAEAVQRAASRALDICEATRGSGRSGR